MGVNVPGKLLGVCRWRLMVRGGKCEGVEGSVAAVRGGEEKILREGKKGR